ncbi:glutathione S-transferase family protein [Trinickia sp.]|uniref:glutathione S-transferase family protein n=1 Tax=Trinickia sp. TaxID=2571163 RepID=UPI003F7EAB92
MTTTPAASAYTLVSHHLCPYVQRAAIALNEKGIAFERRYVDLADKPEWFRAVSPLGKVPLLLVDDGAGRTSTVFESAVICEYLEDVGAGPALHPSDPLERARHRGWIEFGSAILGDIWGLETATDAATYEAKRDTLALKFARVEAQIGEGPLFSGSRMCLVDATFAPIFRYFDVFDALMPSGMFAHTPKLRAWRRALFERQSVVGAVLPDYDVRLRAFLVKHDAYLLKLACHPPPGTATTGGGRLCVTG